MIYEDLKSAKQAISEKWENRITSLRLVTGNLYYWFSCAWALASLNDCGATSARY